MKNKFIVIFSGVIFISFLAIYKGGGGVKKPISESAKNYKIKIATSFYPLYFITSEIAKEKAAVVNLTPSGAEPHDFEPNTQNITNIYESRLLIINGSGFEPWVEKIEEDLRDKNVNILAVAKDLARSEIDEQGGMIKDPHVWLDPILAKQIVIIIKEAIKLIDPENKSFYEENGMKLESKMDELDEAFDQGLSECRLKNIVTSHAAFGYLAKRYGLYQIAITGISPDEEPSAQDLADIADFAKNNSVKYIFFETLVNPRLAQTIADEIGAKTLVFNPLEGLTAEEKSAGSNYISIQKENLENLKTALDCK